jgi:hypothetical protein
MIGAGPLRRWFWLRLSGATAALALVVSSVAVAQSGGVGGAFRTPPKPIDRLNAAIKQININACAPVISQAAAFLFDRGDVQFVVQPLGPDTNRWPTVVTSEGANGDKLQTRLSTLIVAPAGTCSGLYQQVIYWPEPCAAVKARVFADFKGEKVFLRNVKVSEANPGLQLYLMPAGAAGCVSVKKELIG